jgi:hypothetical protein
MRTKSGGRFQRFSSSSSLSSARKSAGSRSRSAARAGNRHHGHGHRSQPQRLALDGEHPLHVLALGGGGARGGGGALVGGPEAAGAQLRLRPPGVRVEAGAVQRRPLSGGRLPAAHRALQPLARPSEVRAPHRGAGRRDGFVDGPVERGPAALRVVGGDGGAHLEPRRLGPQRVEVEDDVGGFGGAAGALQGAGPGDHLGGCEVGAPLKALAGAGERRLLLQRVDVAPGRVGGAPALLQRHSLLQALFGTRASGCDGECGGACVAAPSRHGGHDRSPFR